MEKNYEDEISLKELIEDLIKEKKLIMFMTVTVTLIAVIVSFFVLKPSYEVNTKFAMNIPESVQTKIGVYNYITSNTSDYISIIKDPRILEKTIDDLSLDASVSGLSNSIEVVSDAKDSEKKILSIKVTGSDPELITNIANVHMSNYISFLNNEFKYKAIDSFLKDYEVSSNLIERRINITNKRLEDSKKFLSEMNPVITLQNAISSNPEIAAKYAKDRGINVKDLTKDMLYAEVINPNYEDMDTLILEYKKVLSNSKIDLDELGSKISELKEEKSALDLYNQTGDDSKLRENYLDIFANKVQVISPAFLPENPIGPRKAMNTAIGLVLGLMIGVFSALLKSYWEKN